MRKLNIADFPPDLRALMSLPSGPQSYEAFLLEMRQLATCQLSMALKVLDVRYPGEQLEKRSRIGAEIRRRQRAYNATLDRSANLPREEHWQADFKMLWTEACIPFRQLRR